MSALRKDVKRGAPKTFQKPDDSRRRPYGERTGFRRYGHEDFEEEQSERRPPPRSYDYDRRDREPMHVIRQPIPPRPEGGFRKSPPQARPVTQPVSAYHMKKGLAAARAALVETLHELAALSDGSFVVKDLEIQASFDAQGQFLGFGPGGAATVKIRITPTLETPPPDFDEED